MFTFLCPTCESRLIVKDENLIGMILACPKCGGLVSVKPSDDVQPVNLPPSPDVFRKFPDVLSSVTDSGMIGPLPEESMRADIFLETAPPPEVSETEVKTRKFLLGVLLGLSAFLLIALGFLMLFQEPAQPPLPAPPKPVTQPIVEMPTEQLPEPSIESATSTPVEYVIEEPVEPAKQTLTEPIPIREEPVDNIEYTVSPFEDKATQCPEDSAGNIDIAVKLALPILELNFHQTSLIEFVRLFSRMSGIPMTLDIDEIKPLSLSVNTPVEGRFSETTAEQVLTDTLATLGLRWEATDRQILIFPEVSDNGEDLTFDVSDFAENTNGLSSEVLADWVRRLVCPEADVTVLPDFRLAVEQDVGSRKSAGRLRDEIQRFLEQLRVVRQLPPKTELPGEAIAPEAFGWDEVIKPITLNYYQPVPLSQAAAMLETMTNLTILIDHQSFHRSSCPFASVQATVQCNQRTVNDAMELLLASVDTVTLAYRIIDHQTLEITTAESVRQPEKMTVEVHRYQPGEYEMPVDIMRSLRLSVAPGSWAIPELPETKHGGDIVIEPSGWLFVRQSQPAQRQIRLFLSALEP